MEARRQDMQGVGEGIDRCATMALLKSKKLDPYQKGMLRSILSGAVMTQARLHKAGLACSSRCQFCDAE
eukprot:7276875-Karenia_brevis.AAC.1